ncbi:hypothetical protein M422DRAFT_268399 [Sphaerobolus stellatus SS14]|uniref:Uncharacterized protein n=1 Tax=Sphaerobolus stellatus (strain SS14) TaxID=990650 RepID=A0A0C9TK88_SPHS4|nr:hypothetical protein M422DRAFT_268399 [Sphaerobolus stellatus SS14]
MDDEQNTQMQVDSSTSPMSAIQAFKTDPSTEWVIEYAPGFIAIKHKMGCSICNASTLHCMTAKQAYEIRLAEKDISEAIADTWPELTRYQDNYYCLLEDYNVLKESTQAAEEKAEEPTIKNLDDQVHSLEKKLHETKDNSDELFNCEELILENKHLQREIDYYIGRARYSLYGKDSHWAIKHGYCISDIPASDGEDDDGDLVDLPIQPEEIPQDVPLCPPPRLAHPAIGPTWNDSKVIREAGIPAIGGSHLPIKQKSIIADPPTSITESTLRGASDWVMESDVHDTEMCKLYVKSKALQPHERSLDHTAAIFRIDEYAKSLLGLPKILVVNHNDPDWMTDVIQSFNTNPSRIPRNLRMEGLHVNIDDADVWYWLNLIKPKYRAAEAEVLLQFIFSTPLRGIPYIATKSSITFTYWLGCDAGVTPDFAREKLEPYFLWANEIASLKGGPLNQFCVHEDLLPLVREIPFYIPPDVGEPMDQDESDPEPAPSQSTAGSSSLADRLDYGEESVFSQPPVDARDLQECISYFDSLVPKGTACESTAEITEKLTHDLYADNLE